MKQTIYNIALTVFEITLPLFLLMGAVLVFGQFIFAILGNGAAVLGLNSALKTYSIWVASVCAFSGFIMGYTRPSKQ